MFLSIFFESVESSLSVKVIFVIIENLGDIELWEILNLCSVTLYFVVNLLR